MPILPNPTNMCASCIRTQMDITEGIQKQVNILWCKMCGRYLQPPKHWLLAQPESKELLTYCIKRVKGLQKVGKNYFGLCFAPYSILQKKVGRVGGARRQSEGRHPRRRPNSEARRNRASSRACLRGRQKSFSERPGAAIQRARQRAVCCLSLAAVCGCLFALLLSAAPSRCQQESRESC